VQGEQSVRILKRQKETEMDLGIVERIAAERAYLFAVASRWLRNPERSDDVVQSTLLAGLAGAAEYRGRASVRTWLTAILRHRIVDEQRRRAREPLASDLDAQALPRPEGSVGDPAEEAEALQTALRLQARLESLPPACSGAFLMRELDGRPSAEIRRRLGLTPGQFWQCLHKVRRELRAELALHEGVSRATAPRPPSTRGGSYVHLRLT
jgi:RNA polymerase sigma-70 factor (ECF subfamily)